jgi:DNA polymerase
VTSACDVYRAEVTKEQAKVAVSMYRQVHYPVVEMWEAYNDAAVAAIENPGEIFRVGLVKFYVERRWLMIELPSGRRLPYCDPKIVWEPVTVLELKGETVYASNDLLLETYLAEGATKTGSFQSKKLIYWEVNQKAKKEDCVIPKWAIERTYGGKLFENVVQAVSRDLLAEAIVRAEKKGFNVLMHSHDELVSEAPKGKFTNDDYKKIMEQLPAWAAGLPIKAEGWNDTRYRKG